MLGSEMPPGGKQTWLTLQHICMDSSLNQKKMNENVFYQLVSEVDFINIFKHEHIFSLVYMYTAP